MSSLPKILDVHVFHDEAGVIGEVLQNLSQVHKILEPRPLGADSEDETRVYPEERADDVSQLLQLLLFPNSLNLTHLDSDNIQVLQKRYEEWNN